MSIAGFDDLDLASHVSPALTTMRVPTSDMGRLAADYLLNRLSGDNLKSEKTLDVELIVRGSTAPPNK
jgi:DNA-binding LacI/PurR family transcriptional regulator